MTVTGIVSVERDMKPLPHTGRKPAPMSAKPRQVRRDKPAPVAQAVPPAHEDAGNQAPAMQIRSAEKQTPLQPEVRAAGQTPPPPQELIAPQEYASLLRGLDHEHSPAPAQVHDDLWERLARTGWLPKPPKPSRRTTRAVQRPSA